MRHARSPISRCRFLLPVAATLSIAAGCDGEGRGGGATERVDSAGVVVLTYAGPDRPLSLRRTRSIGRVEGEAAYQLFRVRDVDMGPADTLYVVNSGSSTVRVFAPDGEFGSSAAAARGRANLRRSTRRT